MSSPQQESFQSMATVFILQDKTWIERGSGLVRFVFDLRTFALRLVIRPGTPEEFECKLRPRIRSKGPRAYVVRAQAENGTDEHILAVRFEREEDSRSFRRFVEKRDVDHNQKNNSQSNQNANNYPRNVSDYNNNPAVQQQHRYQNRASSNIAQGGYGSYNSHQIRNGGGGGLYGNNSGLNMYNASNPNIASPSQPNKHGHGGQMQPANYFWTCSRCLQMVDPSQPSCHVCGKVRDSGNAPNGGGNNGGYGAQQQQSGNVLQQISNNPNNGGYGGGGNHGYNQSHGGHGGHGYGGHGGHAPHQQSTTHATLGSHHQINPSSMTPSNRHINHSSHYNQHNQHSQSIASPNGMQQNVNIIINDHNKSNSKSIPKSSKKVHVLKLTTVNLEKHNKLFPPKRRNVKEIVQTQLEYLRTHQ